MDGELNDGAEASAANVQVNDPVEQAAEIHLHEQNLIGAEEEVIFLNWLYNFPHYENDCSHE